MTSLAIPFEGSTVEIGQGDAKVVAVGVEVFDDIAEVKTTDGPGGTTSFGDVSHAQSAAVDKSAGLKDLGQFTVVANYLPKDVGHLSCIAAWGARQLRHIRHTLPDGSIKNFTAYVANYKDNGGVGGSYEATISFEASGDLALT